MSNDTISRQAAKEAYCKHFCHRGAACPDTLCKEVNEAFDELPSAQPERKMGHWIEYDKRFPWSHHYKCSECGNYLDFSGVNAGRGSANYCPNCGADMRAM